MTIIVVTFVCRDMLYKNDRIYLNILKIRKKIMKYKPGSNKGLLLCPGSEVFTVYLTVTLGHIERVFILKRLSTTIHIVINWFKLPQENYSFLKTIHEEN